MAVLLLLESKFILKISIPTPYYFFIFFSTLLIYSIHRLYGLQRIREKQHNLRYQIVTSVKNLLIINVLVSILISSVCYIYLPNSFKIKLLIPCLISASYVLPVFKNRRRLRDLNYVKIFAIALAWALLMTHIPDPSDWSTNHWLFFTSIFCFFVAITIPFDLRDSAIDMEDKVKTISNSLPFTQAIYLAIGLLIMSAFLYSNVIRYEESPYVLISIISYVITCWLIIKTHKHSKEYHFSLWLDGTIGLKSVLISVYVYFLTIFH